MRLAQLSHVSPTAEWTQLPSESSEIKSPPRKVSKYDVGECLIPDPKLVSEDSWLDAGPLLGLKGDQYLKLMTPCIANPQQLWALRHQYLQSRDRLQVLEQQDCLWADDEIRFHLHMIQQKSIEYSVKMGKETRQVTVLDPLLATAWSHQKGFDCTKWAADHPEVSRDAAIVITAVQIERHWIPLCLVPSKRTLHAHTWDKAEHEHGLMNEWVHRLSQALGFEETSICREQRLFFTSNSCGPLAIAFIRLMLIGGQLPSNDDEARQLHHTLRAHYRTEVSRCQIARRPWIWGAGDQPPPSGMQSPSPSTGPRITRDERIDLINSNGTSMGDDEMRYHLLRLIQNQRPSQFPHRTYTYMEPLMFSCWDSIGKQIAVDWCSTNPQVREQGQNVVTVVSIDNHWLPIWIVPVVNTMQVHTFNDEVQGMADLENRMAELSVLMGFQQCTFHRIPKRVTDTDLCGAYALSFIAHLTVQMPLPEDAQELRFLHTNMRASFVEHLYQITQTPPPVVWGTGMRGESGLLPKLPDGICSCCALSAAPLEATLADVMPICDCSVGTRLGHATPDCMGGTWMNDHEVLFHLEWIADQFHNAAQWPGRVFHVYIIPPVAANLWCQGHVLPLQEWIEGSERVHHKVGFVTCLLVAKHWVPIWITRTDQEVLCSTTKLCPHEHAIVNTFVQHLVEHWGVDTSQCHQEQVAPPFPWCGPSAINFFEHVVLGQSRITDDAALLYHSWKLQAKFQIATHVQHTMTPQFWGQGREEDDTHAQPAEGSMPTRAQMIAQHGHAMGDDETLFHLNHLALCSQALPDSQYRAQRQFHCLPPLIWYDWSNGQEHVLQTWLQEHIEFRAENHSIVTCMYINQHWMPVWIEPQGNQVHCHTLHHPVDDIVTMDRQLTRLAGALGFEGIMIHRVPNPLSVNQLCGPLAINFLAHIMVGTPLPVDELQLRHRSWDMKQVFAAHIGDQISEPTLWGWGIAWESRLLPRMPDVLPFETQLKQFDGDRAYPAATHDCLVAVHQGAMGHDEMEFHIHAMRQQYIDHMFHKGHTWVLAVVLEESHWHPIIATRLDGHMVVSLESNTQLWHSYKLRLPWIVCDLPTRKDIPCGAMTVAIIAGVLGMRPNVTHMKFLHHALLSSFLLAQPRDEALQVFWGFGPHGQLQKNLAAELLKHGIPPGAVDQRANDAIRVLGSEQLIAAMNHRQPWKQVKMIGNHAKFQFVLTSELALAVEQNKGKTVGGKGKGKFKTKGPPALVELDPSKLQILEGTFRSQGQIVPQLRPSQIGPVSSGVVLMSCQEAEPYLRAGTKVSQEPLALAILSRQDGGITTALPHATITVPCRCVLDHEPVLADVTLVQIGQGLVEKAIDPTVVQIDSLDVVTLKILAYRDELKGEWKEFCQAPIRCLVSLLPKLKRCHDASCDCEAWHNHESLTIKDPILDVWRRQFLRSGLKPCPAEEADIFTVCIRIPKCILAPLLTHSGMAGAYCEPRTPDGKDILPDYTVVWTPRHSLQEMQHLMRTNPAVTGLARLGDRRGLRVRVDQAKASHQLIRPDSVYLPNGPKHVYTVGPMPYGVDRQAVGRILSKTGWECRPLQPTTPCPGRGAMWLVQSTEEPAKPIVHTSHGEIVITKQKQEVGGPVNMPAPIASAATLALCGASPSATAAENDPWIKQDPWGAYKPSSAMTAPTGPTEGMKQLEDRIQSAVMAKLQPPVEDDMPERVHVLEDQVQQLLAKQQGLEHQMHEYNGQHTQQIAALQGQVQAQSQQLHGHLENQNQTIQSLFEQQMTQIRGLLSKRPRDEGME